MHVMWRLPRDFPSVKDFVESTARYGVRVHSLETGGAHDMGSPYAKHSILLGYSSLSPQEIRTAVRAMLSAVQDIAAGRRPTESSDQKDTTRAHAPRESSWTETVISTPPPRRARSSSPRCRSCFLD